MVFVFLHLTLVHLAQYCQDQCRKWQDFILFFFFMTELYVCGVCVFIYICIYKLINLLYPFIHQWMDITCFCILAIINNASMPIRVHLSFQISGFVLIF